MTTDSGLMFRVRDADSGALIVATHALTADDNVELAAATAGDIAHEYIDRGGRIVLECCDPDGVIFPADTWVVVDRRP